MTQSIEEKIESARQNARKICSEQGDTHPECAAAWDIVEELQAEASHQRNQPEEKTDLQKYCEDNPGSLECKLFDD